MKDITLIFLSLSLSGSILSFLLMALKPFIKNRLSQTWQYYIMLVVILRFILPISPQINIIGDIVHNIQSANSSSITVEADQTFNEDKGYPVPHTPDNPASPVSQNTKTKPLIPPTFWDHMLNHLWILWLSVTLICFTYKVISYLRLIRLIHFGANKIDSHRILEIYNNELTISNVMKPLPLYVNAHANSPMLVGIFRPAIYIPNLEISNDELKYIFRHELTHYKRLDFIYKWFVQITLCLHWFNPIMYMLNKEISRVCELSCDELVIRHLRTEERVLYGDALMSSLKTPGSCGNTMASLAMGKNAYLVKERLDLLMNYKKKSGIAKCLTILLTIFLLCGFSLTGAYAAGKSTAGTKIQIDINPNSTGAKKLGIEIGGSLDGKTKLYIIYSEKGLRAIGTGKYGLDEDYLLGADIKMSDKEWTPIGTADHPFTGYFGGNGCKIISLTMKASNTDVVGLFGYAAGATIQNVTLVDTNFTSIKHYAPDKVEDYICAVAKDCDITDIFIDPKEDKQDTNDQTMKTATIMGKTWYLVETEAQLRSIGTGSYTLNKNYLQNADIDLSSAEWVPIGTKEAPFMGTYNGNGFEIKGLTMTDPNAQIIGMFGVAKKATICHVILRDYDIQSAGSNVTGKSIAPILVFGNTSTKSYDNEVYPKEKD